MFCEPKKERTNLEEAKEDNEDEEELNFSSVVAPKKSKNHEPISAISVAMYILLTQLHWKNGMYTFEKLWKWVKLFFAARDILYDYEDSIGLQIPFFLLLIVFLMIILTTTTTTVFGIFPRDPLPFLLGQIISLIQPLVQIFIYNVPSPLVCYTYDIEYNGAESIIEPKLN